MVTKVRPNSSKQYKIRFKEYGTKYDSWCKEENLKAIEEEQQLADGATAVQSKKLSSKKRKRESHQQQHKTSDEGPQDEEEEFIVQVGNDYIVRLQEGDFPVRVLQFKKNSLSRVKIHYYGYHVVEDSWINVKYLCPLPEGMAEEILILIAEEQAAAPMPSTSSNKGTPSVTKNAKSTSASTVVVKRKKSITKSESDEAHSIALPQQSGADDVDSVQGTATQSRKKRKLNADETETEYVPSDVNPDEEEEAFPDDDDYHEDGMDEDDEFRPDLDEVAGEERSAHKDTNDKAEVSHTTPRTSSSKTIKSIKEESTGIVMDDELATPSKDSNSTSTTPSNIAERLRLSPKIAVPKDDTWQLRVHRAIRVMDRDYVAPIACRQQEIEDIENHIMSCIEMGRGTCIYLSGKPGTGKTQTIFEILDRRDYRMVYVDCMGSRAEDISHRLKEGTASEPLTPSMIPPRTVLILDEVEHFLSSDKTKQHVEELMYWTTQENCPLIVIGIANKLDFRELPLSEESRSFTKKSVIFKPYTDTALEEIVNSRLRSVNALDLFAPRAIKFLCWKIATAKGDARTAIDITQKAVQHIRDHHKENEQFTLGHFNLLLPKWLPSNSTATKLESLTQQQKLVLMVILRSQKSFSETALTMDKIKKECRRIRRFTINMAEMNGAMGVLTQQGIVSMKKSRGGKEEIQILIDRNMVINYFENSQSDLFLRVMRD
eukprot:CAMPEP_0117446924 /NCGR_PEP_ID=MMETSP0759-20121206/6601_1 /TAXON_ID=63605 /ORGANISM="Percolomonas cosmopolitus, Strain WS" /LENGTH=715 /DNA_ID=CAMNT_0005239225 /DNA_START=222 /DNA_END=2369 /DNA_ORIENTATION=+